MQYKEVVNGVYPVMITPFTDDGQVDYDSLIKLTKWYEESGANGLFAICQSSEIFNLSVEEKIKITETIVNHTNLPVVASGNTQDTLEEQLFVMNKIAKTGADALVLLTNMFAKEDEGDDVFIKNIEAFIKNFESDIPLGLYECPFPYKRVISSKELSYILSTERFVFLKDTSCDINIIKSRLDLIKGNQFKLYNANDRTLIESLRYGANGYSGIHANYSTKLMEEIFVNYKDDEKLETLLSLLYDINDNVVQNIYPVSAKHQMMLKGIFKSLHTKVKDYKKYGEANIVAGKKIFDKIKIYEDLK